MHSVVGPILRMTTDRDRGKNFPGPDLPSLGLSVIVYDAGMTLTCLPLLPLTCLPVPMTLTRLPAPLPLFRIVDEYGENLSVEMVPWSSVALALQQQRLQVRGAAVGQKDHI